MVAFTVAGSIALILVEFKTDDFNVAHYTTLISLSSLFGLATFMILCSYCRLTSYFKTYLSFQDEKKMNISAGTQIVAYLIMTAD